MKKINNFKQTAAMQMDVLAKSKASKVYNLAAGDPNLELQQCIVDSYKNLDIQKFHQYGSSQGSLDLRKKLYDNPNQVVITNGAKQALYMSIKAVSNPGDHIVIIGPCWSSYIEICKLLNLKYTLVIGKPEDHYIPKEKDIKKAVKRKTACILFNNPNNPTGQIYSESFINSLLAISNEKGCWLISDEIYGELIYSGDELFSLKGNKNVIYINGFSKAYSLTGWRLGYIIASEEIIKSITNIQSQMSGPPSTLIQQIILDCYEKLTVDIEEYKRRVNILDNLYKWAPQGGFYYYLPIADKWKDSLECCQKLLEEDNIVITPGDDYGVSRTVRLSIANISKEDLYFIKTKLNKII